MHVRIRGPAVCCEKSVVAGVVRLVSFTHLRLLSVSGSPLTPCKSETGQRSSCRSGPVAVAGNTASRDSGGLGTDDALAAWIEHDRFASRTAGPYI